MIPLMILACWMLVVIAVAALCLAARRGDGETEISVSPQADAPAWLQEWESAENLAVYAHAAQTAARRRSGAQAASPLAGVGGAAR